MLKLFVDENQAIPLHCDDYYIKELASGLDELCFSVSIHDADYVSIQEEALIVADDACRYLVKAIDAGDKTASIKCQIDLDDWQAEIVQEYTYETGTPGAAVAEILPNGWRVVDNSGIASGEPFGVAYATPLDVLSKLRSAFYGLAYRFDTINKRVTFVDMFGGENLGAFATRELNLRTNNYKGKSTEFCTRLYAEGKDGLTFEEINAGKPYVDNFSYSQKIVCAYWKDERIEYPAALKKAAEERLAELAVPSRSYDCDVVDLAATDPERYSYLSFPLFSVVGLIDDTRANTKINHIVAERWIYPNLPQKNKVVLSTTALRVQSQIASVIQSINNPNSDWQDKQRAMQDTLTATILGAYGGSVRLLDTDGDGEPDELYIADNPDPAQAVNVWRFNYAGWAGSTSGYDGPFVLGATFENGGTIYANNLEVININGQNINDESISDRSMEIGTLSSGSMDSGVNSSLGNGDAAYDQVNDGPTGISVQLLVFQGQPTDFIPVRLSTGGTGYAIGYTTGPTI